MFVTQPQNYWVRSSVCNPRQFLARTGWSGQNFSHCNLQHFHSLSKQNQVFSPIPPGGLQTQKVNLCALFSCLRREFLECFFGGEFKGKSSDVLTEIRILGEFFGRLIGHTPCTAGTVGLSGKKFQKRSGKTPETLSERFLQLPSRVRLRCPKPHDSRHLRLPEHFQNSLPSVRLGTPLFQNWFQRGPLRAGHGIPSSTEGISDLKEFRRTPGVLKENWGNFWCLEVQRYPLPFQWQKPKPWF